MLSDTINLLPGAVLNSRIPAGTSLPSTAANNSLFFLETGLTGFPVGLYMRRSGSWAFICSKISLTANTTFYVSPAGNDSNDGLSSGNAFKTIQHAVNVVKNRYDLRGYEATINLAAGTYDENVVIDRISTGTLVLDGPTTAIIRNTVAGGICVTSKDYSPTIIKGITFSSTESGAIGVLSENSWVYMDGGHVFTSMGTGIHIVVRYKGSVQIRGNYSITGGAYNHIALLDNSHLTYFPLGSSVVTTLTGNPAFTQFVSVSMASSLNAGDYSVSFTGAATGARYSATLSGAIWVGSKGANLFPGNAAGSVATNGVYSS